jgi:hypothetical protein
MEGNYERGACRLLSAVVSGRFPQVCPAPANAFRICVQQALWRYALNASRVDKWLGSFSDNHHDSLSVMLRIATADGTGFKNHPSRSEGQKIFVEENGG